MPYTPNFPAVYYLDHNIFQQCRLEIPKADIPIPAYVQELNGNVRNIRAMTTHYFDHLHHSLPFISKTRFFEHLLNPLAPPRADVTLLILSIQIASAVPEADIPPEKSRKYLAAKQYFMDLLAAGTFSLQLLQAGVLISLYELGHAIYPAAYMSIGICARYGCSLGLNGQGGSDSNMSPDWIEVEERKRAWWAVLILDR